MVPVEGPKCSRRAAVVLPRESGRREGLAQRCWSSRHAVELNYVIFLCLCSVCRYVGDVWWLRELAWAWKALQMHQALQFPSKRRLSSTYAVVLTVEPLCRQSASPSALRIKGVIWLWSTWKFCIFGLPPSRGMMSSKISCSLFCSSYLRSPVSWVGCICQF